MSCPAFCIWSWVLLFQQAPAVAEVQAPILATRNVKNRHPPPPPCHTGQRGQPRHCLRAALGGHAGVSSQQGLRRKFFLWGQALLSPVSRLLWLLIISRDFIRRLKGPLSLKFRLCFAQKLAWETRWTRKGTLCKGSLDFVVFFFLFCSGLCQH